MIVILDQNIRKLRMWIGELPDACYPIADIAEHVQIAMPSTFSAARQAAVEYYRYTSPHVLDGLLGATFIPQEADRLLVQIARSPGPGQPIDWSINPFYRSEVGLWSSMAVDFVVEGVRESEIIGALGAGVLRFDCAVEGPPIVMKWLVKAVIVLLARSSDNSTHEDLQALMERIGQPFLWYRSTDNSPGNIL